MRLAFATLALACLMSPAVAQTAPVQVPEPGTLGMFAAGIGAAALVLRLWRRK